MGRMVRSCVQSLLKLVNSVIGMVGLSMVLYSIWMFRVWQRHVDGPDYPAPWFIYTFLGIGASLCVITCSGHIAAETAFISAVYNCGEDLSTLSNSQKKKVGCIRIDGGTPVASRQALVIEFQEKDSIRAAVLSIRAAGVGLTFTAASTVIFAELSWTPGDIIQAEDRAHRIGQGITSIHDL